MVLLSTNSAVIAYEFPVDSRSSTTMAATGTIQLAFSPEGNTGTIVVQAIEHATKQILVQTFSFTHSRIARALIDAKRRGVDVQLIADEKQIRIMPGKQVQNIAAAGVPTFVDSLHDSAHNKIMVIDAGLPQEAVITGSFNFTHAAQFRNAENLLIFRGNPQLTQAYLNNWLRHRAHSQTFEPRRY